MSAENGMLYLRSLWQAQIFLIVIKVVMITLLQTHWCAALSLSHSCCGCLTGVSESWWRGRVVSELQCNNPLYITVWRTPWQTHGAHLRIWFDLHDLFILSDSCTWCFTEEMLYRHDAVAVHLHWLTSLLAPIQANAPVMCVNGHVQHIAF